MKILFIEPASPAEHVFSMVNMPRLGSIILATIMRDRGHEARVLVEEIGGEVDEGDLRWADLVAISTITSTAPRAYRLGEIAASLGKKVVYGGPHVTFLPQEALAHGHFVVRGEGEETLPELVESLEGGRDLSSVAGLTWMRDGVEVENPPRGLVGDLDLLPIPDFSLVAGWRRKRAVVPVATSRGCPFNCKFCSVVPMFGRRMRFHSVDRTLEEVRRNGRGARHVFFCDDNFAADPRRAKQLLRRMIEEDAGIEWSTQVRVDAARDEELLELMRKSGCYMVYIGFESINPRTLEAIRKHQNPEEIQAAIRAFHRHGIHIHGMFIVGADEDLPGSAAETARFARRMKIESVQLMMLTPLPGTETFREMEESGRLLTREWSLYDGSYAVFRPRLMTAWHLQTETYRAYLRFYSWASVARKALSFDMFFTTLRWYARRIVVRSRRRVRRYRRQLLDDILAGAQARLGFAAGRKGRVKGVLLADTVEEPYRLFLESFLRRLGVRVHPVEILRQLQDEGQDVGWSLERALSHLRRSSQLLLLPIGEEMLSLGRQGMEGARGLRQRIERNLPPGLDLMALDLGAGKASLYHAAVDLGLVFSRNIPRIHRAWCLALADAGL